MVVDNILLLVVGPEGPAAGLVLGGVEVLLLAVYWLHMEKYTANGLFWQNHCKTSSVWTIWIWIVSRFFTTLFSPLTARITIINTATTIAIDNLAMLYV